MSEEKPRIHFVGIGGIGMSYLARYFKAQNWAVSGSDGQTSELTRQLQKEGVQVKIGHKKGNISPSASRRTLLVVTSQAIQPDNIEVLEAARRGIPVTPFPQVVGGITASYDTIAVAGAHGKSTTTAMTALALIVAGLDPTVMVGTKLKELPHENFRAGRSSYLVLEADEYGRAFLNYSPTLAVVTNIDAEHLDIYKNLADIKRTFLKFLARTKHGGGLVLNADDKNVFSLKKKIEKLSAENHYRVVWYSLKNPDAKKMEAILKVPGAHNVSNALAAFSVGQLLGIKDEILFSAIGNFAGSWRRMEYRGMLDVRGWKLDGGKMGSIVMRKISRPTSNLQPPTLKVFDDYAHHPTEIKATLGAIKHPLQSKTLSLKPFVICVFQPHQAKRLELLFKEFVDAFSDADVLVLLPMYKVPGRDMPQASSVTPQADSKMLYEAIVKKYPRREIYYVENPKNLKNALIKILSQSEFFPRLSVSVPRQSAVVVMMGAGDISQYTKNLISK